MTKSADGSVSPLVSLFRRLFLDKQLIRFLAVGVSNTLISFTVFSGALLVLPASPGMAALAQVLSYGAGMLWSFMLNRLWVFNHAERRPGEALRFALAQVGLMLLSAALISLAVDQLGIQRHLAWLVVMVAITVANFLLMRHWVFRTP